MFRMVLFGVPHLYLGTTDLSKVITGRSLALLVYLAVTGKAQDRNILADLLWDNIPEAQAKKNLRYVLYDLRQAIGDYLLVSRQTIAFNRQGHYWLDVEVFSAYLHAEKPTTNVELYSEVLDLHQGDFLDGFYIQDAPIFEEWLAARRRQLHTQVIHGFHLLTQEYLTQQKYEVGLQLTQRLLTLEPWNEEAHRQQMRLLAYSGRRSAALAQYEACCRALVTEYSAEPLRETTQLYEEIKAGRFATPVEKMDDSRLALGHRTTSTPQPPASQPKSLVKHSVAPPPPIIHVNWDAIPVPPRLFGRVQELARLEQWICKEGCRLISLTGLGGQGKSVLAAEIVRRLVDLSEDEQRLHVQGPAAKPATTANDFDAIFWCSLTGVSSFAQLIAYWWRWCGVLAGLTDLEWLEQDTPLEEQLAYLLLYLRQQRCLLVLDHVEAVLQPELFTGAYSHGWEPFPELLRRVAESEHQSCLLLISREELPEFTYLMRNTSAVRTLPLQGLPMADGVAMLRSHGLAGDENLLTHLAQQYAGLPVALTCVSAMYQRIPIAQLSTLLARDIPLFDELHKLLGKQFARLSHLEQELLLWLTIEQTAVSFDQVWQIFISAGAKGQMLDAYQSLLRRSLLTVEQMGYCIRLPTLVLRYTTQYLIDVIVAELMMAWRSVTPAASVLPTKAPMYELRSKQTVPAWYHREATAVDTRYAELSGDQQAPGLPFGGEQRTLPVIEAPAAVEQPTLPFTLLRRYRLNNPNATILSTEHQNNCILFPIVAALHNEWGVRVTHKRLVTLLDCLIQNVEIDMTIAEYNLRQLLTCLEFTEPCL